MWYDKCVTAPRLVQKGVNCMEIFITFVVAVAAGVASLPLHHQMVRRRQIVGN